MEPIILSPSELNPAAYILTSVDNQRVPSALLTKMRNSRRPMSLDDIAPERLFQMRAEWHRALITTEQVIIDRAYFFNSDVLRREYAEGSPNREAFEQLLASSVVVVYLMGEKTPIDQQAFGVRQFEDWAKVHDNIAMTCVRLGGTNDTENKRFVGSNLFARFRQWLLSLQHIKTIGNFERFLHDLGIPREQWAEQGPAFQAHLERIAAWVGSGRTIAREEFYREFVVDPSSDPVEGKYNPQEPFAEESKEIVDLLHRANLPDAMGRPALYPPGSLDRPVLQEILFRAPRPEGEKPEEKPEDPLLGEAVKIVSFDDLARLLAWAPPKDPAGLNDMPFLASLANLMLSEIIVIRETGEWVTYINDLQELLKPPGTLPENLFQHYIALMKQATSIAQGRMEATKPWRPGITVEVTIGASTMSATWDPQIAENGKQPTYSVVERWVPEGPARVIAKLSIGNVSGRPDQADLDLRLEFLWGKVEQAQATWEKLLKTFNPVAISSFAGDPS